MVIESRDRRRHGSPTTILFGIVGFLNTDSSNTEGNTSYLAFFVGWIDRDREILR